MWKSPLPAPASPLDACDAAPAVSGVASLAEDVTVTLTPPCLSHSRFPALNIQGGMQVTVAPAARRAWSRTRRSAQPAPAASAWRSCAARRAGAGCSARGRCTSGSWLWRRPGFRPRGRFRKRGAGSFTESGAKSMRGSTKRHCDRALATMSFGRGLASPHLSCT